MSKAVIHSMFGGASFFGIIAYYFAKIHMEASLTFILFWIFVGALLGVLELFLLREILIGLSLLVDGEPNRAEIGEVVGAFWVIIGVGCIFSLIFGGFFTSKYLIGLSLTLASIYAGIQTSRISKLSVVKGFFVFAVAFLIFPLVLF